MQDVKFDFNNMFSASIGNEHGVLESELNDCLIQLQGAHAHLVSVIADSNARKRLNLEWVMLPDQDQDTVKKIQKLGSEIAKKYQNVLFLGIGGSYLGLKAAQDALAKATPNIYFEGNNLDPDTLGPLLKKLNPKKTFVVVISKSGETTETKAAFTVVEAWLKKGVGKNYGRQILAITDPISGTLRKIVDVAQAKDVLSFRSLPLLKGVGGRFSEFNMGLLHLAMIGVKIDDALKGALAMKEKCLDENLLRNPASLYAVLHYLLYKNKNKDIAILMPFSETLKSTADWYIQLLAESLGKKYQRKVQVKGREEHWLQDEGKILNTGRTPISARGTNDLHSIQQNSIEGENNKVTTFIGVEKFKTDINIPGKNDILSGRKFSELMRLAREGTEWALVRENRPNCTIILPQVTPFYWGALLFFFEMATAYEGELLNVNAFDQPGVESYKNYMYYKLGKPGLPQEICEEIKNNPLVKNPKFIL